jgi:hypothetical protein
MACATAQQITDIKSDLAAARAHITAIDAALAGPMLKGTKSYSFDSATGRQQETFSSALELIKTRQGVAATRDRLQRSLDGLSIFTTRLRR